MAAAPELGTCSRMGLAGWLEPSPNWADVVSLSPMGGLILLCAGLQIGSLTLVLWLLNTHHWSHGAAGTFTA